jgi:hypothetical protein
LLQQYKNGDESFGRKVFKGIYKAGSHYQWHVYLWRPNAKAAEGGDNKKCGTFNTVFDSAHGADLAADYFQKPEWVPNFKSVAEAQYVTAAATEIAIDLGRLKDCPKCGAAILAIKRACLACAPALDYQRICLLAKGNAVDVGVHSYDAKWWYNYLDKPRGELLGGEFRILGRRLPAQAAWDSDAFLRDKIGVPAGSPLLNFANEAAYRAALQRETLVRLCTPGCGGSHALLTRRVPYAAIPREVWPPAARAQAASQRQGLQGSRDSHRAHSRVRGSPTASFRRPPRQRLTPSNIVRSGQSWLRVLHAVQLVLLQCVVPPPGSHASSAGTAPLTAAGPSATASPAAAAAAAPPCAARMSRRGTR